MIRLSGKALVATWRPYEEGGSSHMRSSQMQSENVTVLDQMVIMQHRDGFWETYPLVNCAIIWEGKPIITLITERDEETTLPLQGRDHTLADQLAERGHGIGIARGPARGMGSSEGEIR